MAIPTNIDRRIRKCMALAEDSRGDPTMRETALRQALGLMRQCGVDPQTMTTTAAASQGLVDWSKRTSAEAAAAGLRQSTLCCDGWYCPPQEPGGR
jgi:hypothetical protein